MLCKEGGGPKKTIDKDTTIKQDLESLIEPVIREDRESPLRWTCKSLQKLSDELNKMGHKTSRNISPKTSEVFKQACLVRFFGTEEAFLHGVHRF